MTSRPSPGQPNTVSTMIEPFRSATNRRAANVTTGSAAFLNAWRQITRRSGRPLMRASLTYSLPRTSSIDERVSRMRPATANQPSVMPGKSTCSVVERAPPAHGGVHADRQRHGDHDQHGQAAELQCGPVALGHQVESRTSEANGATEISLECLGQKAPVLDRPRAIQTEVGAHELDVGL